MQRSLRLAAAAAVALCASSLASCGGGGGANWTAGPTVAITTPAALPPGTTGQPFDLTLAATVPHLPASFYLTGGALPTGTSLDTTNGHITGFPRNVGHFSFEVAARDGVDPSFQVGRDVSFAEDRRTFQIDIARGPVQILPQIPPTAQYRSSYSYQIDAAGGTAPYTFAKTGGTLPNGITVSSTGVLGNFPTQALQHPYHFDVTVTDALGGVHTRNLAFDVVVLPLLIKTSSLPDASEGFPYTTDLLLASGGGGPPYTWGQEPVIAGETLLSSISMQVEAGGKISSIGAGPTTAGIYTFTVGVTDEALQHVTRQLTLKVTTSPVLSDITPKVALAPGPFTATGLKFLPGAVLVFAPGTPAAKTIATTYVSPIKLTFAAAPSLSAAGPITVRVLNPDGGFYDLAGAVLYSASTISFGQKGFIPSAVSSFGLDCADVNKDGKADVIHCGYAGFSSFPGYSLTSATGGLHLFMNNGNLTFTQTVLSATSFTACKFVDVDSDGDLDIVALRPGAIQSWLNNGLGTFVAGSTSAIPAVPAGITSDMAIGSFNSADSIPDIIYGSGGNTFTGSCYIALGNGFGGFAVSASATSGMSSNFYGVNSVTSVKIDGDTIDDAVAGPAYYSSSLPFYVRSIVSSTGTFGAWAAGALTTTTWNGVACVRTGNFLNKPVPCIVSSTIMDPTDSAGVGRNELNVFSGANLATNTPLTIPAGITKSIGISDFDFDGVMDFAVTAKICINSSASPPTGGTCDLVYVYKGATGVLTRTLNIQTGAPLVTFAMSGRVAAGDLDGDGRPDILISTSFWATDNQQQTTWQRSDSADGNAQGIVFYLNNSL
jgi:hypothetical protein